MGIPVWNNSDYGNGATDEHLISEQKNDVPLQVESSHLESTAADGAEQLTERLDGQLHLFDALPVAAILPRHLHVPCETVPIQAGDGRALIA